MASISKMSGRLSYEEITKLVVVHGHYQQGKDGKATDNLIDMATFPQDFIKPKSDSTHSEIGFWIDGELWFCSSTSRNRAGKGEPKSTGARWIKATDLMPDEEHAKRWILHEEYRYCDLNVISSISRANRMMDITYDMTGVTLGFLNPIKWFKKRTVADVVKHGKDYCSAFCHLVRHGWTKTISPKRLYRKCLKRGVRVVEDNMEYLKGTE